MKKVWIAALSIAALGVVAVPFAHADRTPMRHHGMGLHGMHMMEHLGMLKEKLDLSDAQVSELKSIAREVHEQNSSSVDTMKSDFKQVAAVLLTDPNDVGKAESILAQNDAARVVVRQNILRGVSRALNVLTPEQRTRLAQMVAEHQEKL